MNKYTGVRSFVNLLWIHSPRTHFLGPDLLTFLVLGVAGLLVFTFVMVYATIAVWAERKVAGHVQDRLGPMRVGWHGWLQTLADGVKLMMKEDIVPTSADKYLFILAPAVVFLAGLAGYAAIPFSERAQMADLDIGVLYVFAMTSLIVVGIIMAGWASNSKWPLYGAMRSAALIVSYGVPLTLSAMPALMIAGSLSFQKIVISQVGGLMDWNVFRALPFMPLAFMVFYISSLAETNRVPFDIAEAESELVGGYHTEYSGILFSFFFMAEYATMFLSSAVASTLFLGGYLPPNFHSLGMFGIPRLLAWLATGLFLYWRFKSFHERKQHSEAVFFAVLTLVCLFVHWYWPHFFWFMMKTSLLFFVMLWLRWTLPRLRIDQMMYMCWKVLTPLAFINLLGVGVWWCWTY